MEGEGGGGVISSVYGVVSQRRPVTLALPRPTSPHGSKVLRSEGKHIEGWGFVSQEGKGSTEPVCVQQLASSPLLFRTSREEPHHYEEKNKKVGRYYGDCVAGLLWAELGDRLGLQLPEGSPPGRLAVAPLSRPSEFSSISWMSGGMEPGISILRVMTRSAPVEQVGGRQRKVSHQRSH